MSVLCIFAYLMTIHFDEMKRMPIVNRERKERKKLTPNFKPAQFFRNLIYQTPKVPSNHTKQMNYVRLTGSSMQAMIKGAAATAVATVASVAIISIKLF